MPKKYYAVKNGKVPGIYESWSQCKAQVDGFKCAAYKSFPTKEQAIEYMGMGEEKLNSSKEDTAVAYVDGSYRHDTREFASGAILFYKGEEHRFSQKFSDPSLCEMRNVAGEIMGAKIVMDYCMAMGIHALEIHHDYEGVAKWATGEWKANKPGTIAYKAYCAAAKENLSYVFVKVQGHSGDKYNDLADSLAKQALGIG